MTNHTDGKKLRASQSASNRASVGYVGRDRFRDYEAIRWDNKGNC